MEKGEIEVTGDNNVVVGGDMHVYDSGFVPRMPPAGKGRTCPQCTWQTWRGNRHCMHCAFDVFAYDTEMRRRAAGRRMGWVAVIAGALALGSGFLVAPALEWLGFQRVAGWARVACAGFVFMAICGLQLMDNIRSGREAV